MTAARLLVRARSLTGFNDLVRSCGAAPAVLLADVGIAPELAENPDAVLPLPAFSALLAHCADVLKMPDFGIRLAAGQDVTVLGVIALIALNSATVGEALAGVIRGMPFHSPGLHGRVIADGSHACVTVRHDLEMIPEVKRQLAEHSLLNAVSIIRSVAQVSGSDWVVHFDHGSGFPVDDYQRLFGCSVLFDQRDDEVIFPAGLLAVKIQSANSELRDSGERYVRSVIRRHPLDLALQVEELLGRQLGAGRCTLPVIAKQLGIPTYSLQRRLAEQNVRFEDVIDNLRRRRAMELLPLTNLPLTRVADCLGYSSQTSFTRSCRRWFGEAPQALRVRRQ